MIDVQFELFPVAKPSAKEIVAAALAHNPVARFALFSGGDGSLEATHWLMENVPGCEVLHIVTGIGLKLTTEFVRETCERQGWPLTVLRAKEDCGQDYREIVREHGFPGPAGHQFMYRRLKDRAIELVVRQRKQKRSDKVMLATGIRRDDSQRRTGYGGREINFRWAQMWVNPFYWRPSIDMAEWSARTGIPRNPASITLGMSGECLCGAFATPGELGLVRLLEPDTADYIEELEREAFALGHCWRWEERPPRSAATVDAPDLFNPMCVNCMKSQRAEAA